MRQFPDKLPRILFHDDVWVLGEEGGKKVVLHRHARDLSEVASAWYVLTEGDMRPVKLGKNPNAACFEEAGVCYQKLRMASAPAITLRVTRVFIRYDLSAFVDISAWSTGLCARVVQVGRPFEPLNQLSMKGHALSYPAVVALVSATEQFGGLFGMSSESAKMYTFARDTPPFSCYHPPRDHLQDSFSDQGTLLDLRWQLRGYPGEHLTLQHVEESLYTIQRDCPQQLQYINRVDLSYNNLVNFEAIRCLTALGKILPHLRVVDLSHNCLHGRYDIHALLEQVSSLPFTVLLHDNPLAEDSGTQKLMRAYRVGTATKEQLSDPDAPPHHHDFPREILGFYFRSNPGLPILHKKWWSCSNVAFLQACDEAKEILCREDPESEKDVVDAAAFVLVRSAKILLQEAVSQEGVCCPALLEERAAQYLEAASTHSYRACVQLAICYLEGVGVGRNDLRGRQLLEDCISKYSDEEERRKDPLPLPLLCYELHVNLDDIGDAFARLARISHSNVSDMSMLARQGYTRGSGSAARVLADLGRDLQKNCETIGVNDNEDGEGKEFDDGDDDDDDDDDVTCSDQFDFALMAVDRGDTASLLYLAKLLPDDCEFEFYQHLYASLAALHSKNGDDAICFLASRIMEGICASCLHFFEDDLFELLEFAVPSCHSYGTYLYALLLEALHRLPEATAMYIMAASLGEKQALAWVGEQYEEGKNVCSRPQYDTAISYYKKATEKGHADSYAGIARCHLRRLRSEERSRGQQVTVDRILQKGIDNGSVRAAVLMGRRVLASQNSSTEVVKFHQELLEVLYRLSRAQACHDDDELFVIIAQFVLSGMGTCGIARTKQDARGLLLRSARAGSREAMRVMAMEFPKEYGHWLRLAKSLGDEEAEYYCDEASHLKHLDSSIVGDGGCRPWRALLLANKKDHMEEYYSGVAKESNLSMLLDSGNSERVRRVKEGGEEPFAADEQKRKQWEGDRKDLDTEEQQEGKREAKTMKTARPFLKEKTVTNGMETWSLPLDHTGEVEHRHQNSSSGSAFGNIRAVNDRSSRNLKMGMDASHSTPTWPPTHSHARRGMDILDMVGYQRTKIPPRDRGMSQRRTRGLSKEDRFRVAVRSMTGHHLANVL